MSSESLYQSLNNLYARIGASGTASLHSGICGYLNFDDTSLFYDICQHWPKHSGHRHYPVPHRTKRVHIAFSNGAYDGNLWDQSTEYGQDRKALLDFCIQYMRDHYGYD